jgi:hypothetical protein
VIYESIGAPFFILMPHAESVQPGFLFFKLGFNKHASAIFVLWRVLVYKIEIFFSGRLRRFPLFSLYFEELQLGVGNGPFFVLTSLN